ncbi:MAG: GNAT family N-acetyltransferase [Geminicoccaceae bacterium]
MSPAASFSLPDWIDPETPTTVSGIDGLIGDWVTDQLDLPAGSLSPCAGIGVTYRGSLIAGVAFNNYRPYQSGAVIDASIAATSPRWATRTVLRDFFSYPFAQMKVTRLQVVCRKSNKHARKFVTRLGFRMEGVARRLWDGKYDAVVYSMMPDECRWIDG